MTGWRALAAGVLAVGCGSGASIEPSDAQAQPIVAGEPSGAEHDGVVLLRAVMADESEALCSASLVGPNLIMTARHCVAYMSEGPFSCSTRGELIDNPTGGGRLGRDLPAENLEIYSGKTPRRVPLARGAQVISTLPPTLCQNDIAFVVLDTSLDLPVVPLRLGRPAEPNELAVLVGYGTSVNDQLISYKTQLRQEKHGLKVAAVGPDSIDDGVTTAPPRALILEGPSGCIGDSGGPLLAESSGAALGVYSLQRGNSCSAPNVRNQLVHVPPFQTLIGEAFAAAGCEPVVEADPTEPQGTGGAGAAPNAGAGNESSEPSPTSGGAGGAAGEVVLEPEVTPKASDGSGCGVVSAPGVGASGIGAVLALGALVRRRQCAGRRR